MAGNGTWNGVRGEEAAAEGVSGSPTIMVVDDESANLNLLRRMLEQHGYGNVVAVQDARLVVSTFMARAPDLVILDLRMPYVDGMELLHQIRAAVPSWDYLPIVVVSGDHEQQARRDALQAGANDFLNKPFDVVELRCRADGLLAVRRLHRRLAGEKERLEAMVRDRTRELADSEEHLLDCLAIASDMRDDDTREHSHRVGDLAAALAAELGRSAYECELIRRAARLHDVGKIGVPDAILLKPGPLTPAERARMKMHTLLGARMLSGARSPLLRLAAEIARSHHEQWNGKGYPDGLRGEAIPWAARIVNVADVFDALSHDRPYHSAWSSTRVLRELTDHAGVRYDPAVVAALARVMEARSLVPPRSPAVHAQSPSGGRVHAAAIRAPAPSEPMRSHGR